MPSKLLAVAALWACLSTSAERIGPDSLSAGEVAMTVDLEMPSEALFDVVDSAAGLIATRARLQRCPPEAHSSHSGGILLHLFFSRRHRLHACAFASVFRWCSMLDLLTVLAVAFETRNL